MSVVPTFSKEDLLPSLPLPPLKSTLNRYLDSIRPFVNDIEYLTTEKKLSDFENGIGGKLDFILRDRARKEKNWLEDWWFDWAYLEWRLPIAPLINTSGHYYNLNFIQNRENFTGYSIQAAVAALQLYYTLCYFDDLRNERVPVEKSKNGYLSMVQYRRLFNTCRIPLKLKDRLDNHFRTHNEGQCPKHIIVSFKNRLFSLNVYHPSNNNLLNVTELYITLENLVKKYEHEEDEVGIGALTGDDRDVWTDNRDYLKRLDNENENKLRLIETSIILLALDNIVTKNHEELFTLALADNPKNRYFDKSYQLIITKNGHVTVNTDHTPFDGIVSVNLAIYGRNRMIREKMNDFTKINSLVVRNTLPIPNELKIVYDLKIKLAIEASIKIFNKYAKTLDIQTAQLEFCTKTHVKSYKVHPDTFTQMVMQLAYYRLHQKPAPTYETASTRGYYHGRTETMRTCTKEVVAWCKAMSEQTLNKTELLGLFKIAYENHDKLISQAGNNAGCDRHLLGLKLTAQKLNLDEPDIFKDVSWTKSGGGGNFIISSSCLGFSDVFGGCFAMCEDGYGIFYRISDDGIAFLVSTYNTSKISNGKKMIDSLKESAKVIQSLYETTSKL